MHEGLQGAGEGKEGAGRTYTQRLCKGALLVRQAFRQAKAEVCWVIHILRPSRGCGVTVCLAMARRLTQG